MKTVVDLIAKLNQALQSVGDAELKAKLTRQSNAMLKAIFDTCVEQQRARALGITRAIASTKPKNSAIPSLADPAARNLGNERL